MFKWKLINSSFGDSYQKSVKETTPDSGSNYKRQQFTVSDNIIKGYIILDSTEREEFRTFYIRDTKQGQFSFSYQDCITNETREALFVGVPMESKLSNKFKIDVVLRLKAFPTNSIREFNFNFNNDNAIFNSDNAIVLTRR